MTLTFPVTFFLSGAIRANISFYFGRCIKKSNENNKKKTQIDLTVVIFHYMFHDRFGVF